MDQAETDFTEKIRRGAVGLLPAMVLFHLLVTAAMLPPEVIIGHVVFVPLAVAVGYSLRKLRRATVVLGLSTAICLFSLTYLCGVAAPMAYLTLVELTQWSWTALLACLTGHTAFLGYVSIRAYQREWAVPLDQTVGVHLNKQYGTVRREVVPWDEGKLTRASTVLLVVLFPLLYFARGKPAYLMFAMLILPHFVAIVGSVLASRWIAFFVAVRRWEAANKVRLYFPPLAPKRRRRAAQPRSSVR